MKSMEIREIYCAEIHGAYLVGLLRVTSLRFLVVTFYIFRWVRHHIVPQSSLRAYAHKLYTLNRGLCSCVILSFPLVSWTIVFVKCVCVCVYVNGAGRGFQTHWNCSRNVPSERWLGISILCVWLCIWPRHSWVSMKFLIFSYDMRLQRYVYKYSVFLLVMLGIHMLRS